MRNPHLISVREPHDHRRAAEPLSGHSGAEQTGHLHTQIRRGDNGSPDTQGSPELKYEKRGHPSLDMDLNRQTAGARAWTGNLGTARRPARGGM